MAYQQTLVEKEGKVIVKITFDTLTDLAYDADGTAYPHYSGRAMYGKTCVGIVLDESNLLKLGFAIGTLFDDDTRDYLVENYKTDTMGYNTIVYWTGVTCEDAPEEDEDE